MSHPSKAGRARSSGRAGPTACAGTDLSVVISGGASGIGAATARRIVAAGGHVGILDVNGALARQVAKGLGERAVAVTADVLDEGQVRRAHRRFATALPDIRGLVNCAGMPQVPRTIEEYAVEDWSAVLDSHLRTTYVACREFGGAMARRGAGAIVNLASVLAFRPGPVLAYGPAKAAVVSLTESLAVQWAHRGVRVNAVAPGWTDTPFLRPKERKGERDLTPIIRATPLGRLLKPQEIAEVIVFLLSAAASGVTGATVACDGGVMAGSGWMPYGGIPA
ncbi:MAG: SDR family NAD(P)-dependent oxidoreductase [Betaproteobacteria bacterium]|nr:SDR family NAD(P)-dependent oxidoreductase [Betaproteobacteria bacterium]